MVVDTLFTPEQEAAIRAAAERWAAVIVGDLPDQPLEEGYVPAHQCEGVEESEIPPGGAVADVLLAVTLVDDDRHPLGPGNLSAEIDRTTTSDHSPNAQATSSRGYRSVIPAPHWLRARRAPGMIQSSAHPDSFPPTQGPEP